MVLLTVIPEIGRGEVQRTFCLKGVISSFGSAPLTRSDISEKMGLTSQNNRPLSTVFLRGLPFSSLILVPQSTGVNSQDLNKSNHFKYRIRVTIFVTFMCPLFNSPMIIKVI